MSAKRTVILDTDIGSDIDDAVCLSYLLCEPRCDLIGITTVSGQPRARAALADAVCRGAGRDDIPVYSGIDRSFLGGVVQADCDQQAVLPKVPHRPPESFEPYAAVPWLRKTIRERPGEITLMGIGQLMNIAALFASDPEIPELLGGLILMCGCFFEPRPYSHEWNARLDPTSTAIVYHGAVKEHVSIGLDVTMQCKLPTSVAISRFKELGGPLSVVAAMVEAKPKEKRPKEMVFHDPLTAVSLFEPSICEWETGAVSVELLSQSVGGMTHFKSTAQGGAPLHRAARTVDANRFFAQYFSVFGANGSAQTSEALAV